MHKILLAASAVFLATAWLASRSLEVRAFLSTESLPTRAEEGVGSQIVVRAQELLASLDAEGRRAATFDYGDKERFNWHFIPRERKGIPLNQLSEDQKKKAKTLLSASLSELGVQKADQVRELEGILRDIEGPNRRFSRDPEEYFVSVFGEPATEGRWGWRFEGHHLALNFSLDGARLLSATPLLYGANPAIVEKGPKKGLRVLASLEDVARELVTSLDDEQKKAALGEKTEEVKATRSATYNEALPSGVSWGKLSEKQRQLLRKLVREYTAHLKAETRREIHQAIVNAGKDGVQFVWRGGTKPYERHSYLVHGPTFVISYANFQNGAKHIHAGLRHLPGEFGLIKDEN